jgi:hypothetical protein
VDAVSDFVRNKIPVEHRSKVRSSLYKIYEWPKEGLGPRPYMTRI